MADVLVLNADAQPVSYLPLSAVQWKEAITYMFLDKCTVLEWYDDWVVHSANWETRVPAVIILKNYLKRRHSPRFSKTNVFIRDMYSCQYCSESLTRQLLTLDHVIPLSKGGKTCWENIVSSCAKCNSLKGDRTDIKPRITPRRPDYFELVNKRKRLDFEIKHESWLSYI